MASAAYSWPLLASRNCRIGDGLIVAQRRVAVAGSPAVWAGRYCWVLGLAVKSSACGDEAAGDWRM